ncbi:signal transduction histidine kinase, LytS (plasmid) [Granulicella tundricola MP5ACTX9]|uniref:Signal transduction histidine kinase, LytS n=2 Tax=Granulicella TaxID=940557 RepID=E8X7I5_GRATM|nr:signal transduction histidine kinase, LytS [Granulicella tundricola MP5ACTX9]
MTSLAGPLISLLLSVLAERLLKRGTPREWCFLGGIVLLAGSALWTVDLIVQAQTLPLLSFRMPNKGDLLMARFNWVYCNLLFSLQTVALALLASSKTLLTREKQLAIERAALQQARLTALRYQLNPHFLFNTLNTISSLAADSGAHEAEEMIAGLADFMRASLSSSMDASITLAAELETTQAYLAIESVRFGERLVVEYLCEPDLSDALVPSLILQPLVENAVKYGVARSKEAVHVRIAARANQKELILTVEDDGCCAPGKLAKAGTGVGLKNVAERLDALHGKEAIMRTEQRTRGFLAELRMPLNISLSYNVKRR